MTAAVSSESAMEIIASHGADPARWPDGLRDALLALAAQDGDVAMALAEARALDAALFSWAQAPADGEPIDVAAILALPQDVAPARRAGMAWRPALLAASLALVVAVGGWVGFAGRFDAPASPQIAAAPTSAGASASEADVAFAYVFTPTAAEEDLI